MKIFPLFDEHVAHIVGLGGDEEDEDLLLQSCVGSCRNWGRWLLARLPPEMFSPSTPKSKKEGQGGVEYAEIWWCFCLEILQLMIMADTSGIYPIP